MIAVSAAVALACVVAGRRGHEQNALLLAVVLMLAASPLIWNHYFAVLIVPLGDRAAAARPAVGSPARVLAVPDGRSGAMAATCRDGGGRRDDLGAAALARER